MNIHEDIPLRVWLKGTEGINWQIDASEFKRADCKKPATPNATPMDWPRVVRSSEFIKSLSP